MSMSSSFRDSDAFTVSLWLTNPSYHFDYTGVGVSVFLRFRFDVVSMKMTSGLSETFDSGFRAGSSAF